MSMARVKTVSKAQKDQGTCEKCGKSLPKGEPYRWFKVGFRSRHKHVRCTDASCTPRPSELESTSKADIYAAFEDYYANPVDPESEDWTEDLRGAMEPIVEAYANYLQEKEDALEAWPNGNSQFEDVRDGAQEANDAAEQVEVDEEAESPEDEINRVIEELDAAQENLR